MLEGVPLRDHLNKIWNRGGVKPEQLDFEPLPDWLQYIWRWFIELHNTRGQAMEGMLPISYSEMESWANLTGNEPTPWDVRAIKALDAVACRPKEKL